VFVVSENQRGSHLPDRWPPLVEKYLLPYLREPAGWPITFAVVGHLAVLQALVGLTVWRSQSPPFLFLFVAYVVMTMAPIRTEWRCSGGFGVITALWAYAWLTTAGIAWWAGSAGYF